MAKEAFAKDLKQMHAWTSQRKQALDAGRPDLVAQAIRRLIPKDSPPNHPFQIEAKYFDTNSHRMKYREFRAQGLFVGSGVLEAGCRTVVAQRLKQSGMHWTVDGANSIISLRACFLSNRWENFWESRCAA